MHTLEQMKQLRLLCNANEQDIVNSIRQFQVACPNVLKWPSGSDAHCDIKLRCVFYAMPYLAAFEVLAFDAYVDPAQAVQCIDSFEPLFYKALQLQRCYVAGTRMLNKVPEFIVADSIPGSITHSMDGMTAFVQRRVQC